MSREVNLGIRDEFVKYRYGVGFKDDAYWMQGLGLRDEYARYGYGMGYKDDAYWLRGLGASFPDFLNDFNAQVARYDVLARKAGALGSQQGSTFDTLVGESIGTGRNPTGGLLSAIESIRFDIKHYPGKMDTKNLSAIRVKLDVLAGVVDSMTEQPSAPTQDDETARALEYSRSEVDRLTAERQALLASQISGDILGLSRKTWMYIGGGVAALTLVGIGVSQLR